MPDLPAPHLMRKHIFVICHAGLACTALDAGIRHLNNKNHFPLDYRILRISGSAAGMTIYNFSLEKACSPFLLLLNKIRSDILIIQHCAIHNPPDQATACYERLLIVKDSDQSFRYLNNI